MTGGAEDEFERLLKHFSSKPEIYEIHGMFPRGERSEVYASYCSKVGYYRYGHLPVINEGILPYLKYILKLPIQLYQIIKFAWGQKYDVAAVNVVVLLWPVIAMKLLFTRVIVFIREDVHPKWLRNIIYIFLVKSCSFLIPNSKTKLRDIVSLTGSQNVMCIYPSVEDYTASSLNDLREKLSDSNYNKLLEPGVFRFLNPARILHKKNQMLIVEALAKIKEKATGFTPQVVFLGFYDKNDPYYISLLEFIKINSLSDKCIFLGELDRKLLYKIYELVDAVVLTSISEGLPLVMVESFKFQKPFISTKVGGIPEIVQTGETGMLVEFDSSNVGETMLEIMSNKGLYEKIRKEARKHFEKKFDIVSILKETEGVFLQVIKNGTD